MTLQAVEVTSPTVFSLSRDLVQPEVVLPDGLLFNTRQQMDGLDLLGALPEEAIPAAFFDPQYRGVLDYLSYGNEGVSRGGARSSLVQMTDIIPDFISEMARVLLPSGHLFLWIDKYHLMAGFREWLDGEPLEVVDMVTWSKDRMGMGYRTRRFAEYLVVLQKRPTRAKGVWKVHDIPDIWVERVPRSKGVHPKPVGLQSALIKAVTNEGDIVVDPAAGSFSVMDACLDSGRLFLGCDLNG